MLITLVLSFLENTVTQVIAFEGNGHLEEFGGGYDDWKRFTDQQTEKTAMAKPKTEPTTKPVPPKPSQAKLNYKEQRELETLPERIEALEAEQTSINTALADPDIYRTDPQRVKALQSRLGDIESGIEQSMTRWEELESRR